MQVASLRFRWYAPASSLKNLCNRGCLSVLVLLQSHKATRYARELHVATIEGSCASRVCHGETVWDVFRSIDGTMEELNGRSESCLHLNFMLALLHTGYEMPIDRGEDCKED